MKKYCGNLRKGVGRELSVCTACGPHVIGPTSPLSLLFPANLSIVLIQNGGQGRVPFTFP